MLLRIVIRNKLSENIRYVFVYKIIKTVFVILYVVHMVDAIHRDQTHFVIIKNTHFFLYTYFLTKFLRLRNAL